jgi:flagellar motor component MotA
MIWQAIYSFGAMVTLDLVWAAYTLKVQDKKPALAGMYASAIMIINAVVTLSYINDPWMLLPVMAGAFVGTYVGVRYL